MSTYFSEIRKEKRKKNATTKTMKRNEWTVTGYCDSHIAILITLRPNRLQIKFWTTNYVCKFEHIFFSLSTWIFFPETKHYLSIALKIIAHFMHNWLLWIFMRIFSLNMGYLGLFHENQFESVLDTHTERHHKFHALSGYNWCVWSIFVSFFCLQNMNS